MKKARRNIFNGLYLIDISHKNRPACAVKRSKRIIRDNLAALIHQKDIKEIADELKSAFAKGVKRRRYYWEAHKERLP